MLQSKSFVKKTKHGKVLKVTREHYLRDDIVCGVSMCKLCDCPSPRLTDGASSILIVDTNIVLNQIDLLENPAIDFVVVLSVVLEEVKNKNRGIYDRLRALCSNGSRYYFVFSNEHHRDTYVKQLSGESPNDRNDRAIRVAAQWYQQHLGDRVKILLLTNDKENMRRAIEEGIQARDVESYVKSLGQPHLLDLITRTVSQDEEEKLSIEDTRPAKRKIIYNEHKPLSEITSGLRCGIYHQGRFRVNLYNRLEAYVGSESISDEIVIHGRSNMNRAFDGDIVAVELLLPENRNGKHPYSSSSSYSSAAAAAAAAAAGGDGDDGDGDEIGEDEHVRLVPISTDDAPSRSMISERPHGLVIGIIKRNWRSYCGSLEKMAMPAGTGGVANALFISKDRRVPKIRIQTRQLENLIDKRIAVTADSWDCRSRYPSGHYVRTIGKIGDRDTETEVVLIDRDIESRSFSAQVMSCLPPLPWSADSDAAAVADPLRGDLRHLRVFSVDPPGCKDIDDALHCTSLPDGNFEVGVHIADVTHFVRPGTTLDEEASRRGTSVYLVDRRIDMLPKPLTEDVCSLRSDVDRLAFSVVWVMTPEADVLSTRHAKSVIRSRASLSYVEAQARMDDPRLTDALTSDLRSMNGLARAMRKRRIDRGALTLASPEVKFEIDTETLDPLDIGMYQIREANQMVEEFMLAANVSAAEKILEHFPSRALLRRHPSPTPESLEPLVATAAAAGICIDASSSRKLADSLDLAVGSDPYFNKMVRILATRCMMPAAYFCSGDLGRHEFHHYGLAAPLYTHFTSPIRRYADVVVHRLLAASLGIEKLHTVFDDGSRLKGISDNLNRRHRNAQLAGRESVELHTLMYFRKWPTDAEARILKVRSNGLVVFVPKFGIEGLVRLKEEEWRVDEQRHQLVKKAGSLCYSVLQTVRVSIQVTETSPNWPRLQLTVL